jgi:hypothetical protein
MELFEDLKVRLRGWAGIKREDARRLGERLIIVVQFPTTSGGRTANDVRAFLTTLDAGSIGVALGVLEKNLGAGFVQRIGQGPSTADSVEIFPAQVHVILNRDLAASISGHALPDRRPTILVGAGSLGSQVAVLPHNLARHALFAKWMAAPKAVALARELSELLGEPFEAARFNIFDPLEQNEKLAANFSKAELIIDASASVAVSRHLSDLPGVAARRVCAFFNPSGTAAVLLVEDAQRVSTLLDLEAQYYRLLLTEPSLKGHLQQEAEGVRYSGSCRALTNRIPASRATLLSALVSRGVMDAVNENNAEIRIWTCKPDDAVESLRVPAKKFSSCAPTIGLSTMIRDCLANSRRGASRDCRAKRAGCYLASLT